ncbi:MAG TPA: hypothetical protein VIL48_17775 [Acidimicrobiales bacterium]
MTAVTDDPRRGAWAMPGSAAEQDDAAPPVVAAAPDPGAGDAASAPAGPASGAGAGAESVPRVALRPMTVADVLDGGFAVIKARPRKILGFAAGFVVPVQLLGAFLQRRVLDDTDSQALITGDFGALASGATDGGDLLLAVLVGLLPSLALVCVAAGLAHLVAGWVVGRDAPVREMLGVVGRRWWPLLATFVVVHLAEAGGAIACYIGILFVMPLFVVVAPVIGAEEATTVQALSRATRLVRTRYFPVMGVAVLMGIVSIVLGYALASVPQVAALAIGAESGWPLLALAGILSEVVTTPFVAAGTVLLYLDLRVRNEGLDIEIAARQLLDLPR